MMNTLKISINKITKLLVNFKKKWKMQLYAFLYLSGIVYFEYVCADS